MCAGSAIQLVKVVDLTISSVVVCADSDLGAGTAVLCHAEGKQLGNTVTCHITESDLAGNPVLGIDG